MIEIQLRRYNGHFNPKVVAALERKIKAIARIEPVYLDFEGVRGLDRGAVEALVAMAAEIGESRIRLIGISREIWEEFHDLWLGLGAIAVPPPWI